MLAFLHYRLHRIVLLISSAVALVSLIYFTNIKVLPFDVVTFIFFSFVLLLFALYRPGWTFLLLIGVIPLEVINVAPVVFGDLMLRPYQWLAGVLLCAVGIRVIAGRLPFRLFRPILFDVLPVFIALGSFVALFWAPVLTLALKQAVIASSFVVLYFLGRVFLRTFYDVSQTLPFFVLSSVIVFGYALWQNVRFAFGQTSFQVMVGRPNATFAEADWLGMFSVLALGVALMLLSLSLTRLKKAPARWEGRWLFLGVFGYTVLVCMVLILSVARSAWLGASAVAGIFVFGLLLRRGWSALKQSCRAEVSFIFSFFLAFAVSVGLVLVFHLSPFQFLNRIQSTGSGWQKITVACQSADTLLPRKLSDMGDLQRNGCRHIALEEIEKERASGQSIQEVYRPDPNVAIRREIYRETWSLIQQHPLSGIGFGSVALSLGTDERGAELNASNVFMELWLGSGMLGLSAFVVFWCLQAWHSWRWYRETESISERVFALFLVATVSGLTVFNLFNSGLFLGFFFLFLAFGAVAIERYSVAFAPSEKV